VSLPDTGALAQCLRGGRWDPALFPALLASGQQQGNLGELLTAVGALAPAVDAEPWAFDPGVDGVAFEALGFGEASEGITRTQRENREGWWAHARRNRAFILDAAQAAEARQLAVVFGAGKAYDLPLPELARRYERLVLVDIDGASLRATVEAAVSDCSLRARIEMRVMDITGISVRMARGIDRAVSGAADARAAETALEALCRSYRLAEPPVLLAPGERADLLVSDMVLSQIGLQPKLAAKRRYEKRYGAIRDGEEMAARWSDAWNEFELRVQQDHINALTRYAERVVLTSDVVHQSTTVLAGAERPYGEPWSVVGTRHLRARIAPFQEIVAEAGWSWPRIGANVRRGDGVVTQVEALLLRARNSL
jgi:hypothetical protein